ncbi:MAG: glycoside hydrolase family 97 protein [Aurantibacter sp.]
MKKIGRYLGMGILIYLLPTSGLKAQNYTVTSPQGNNQIEVFLSDQITYQVKHNGKVILGQSPISITINGRKLGINPSARKARTKTVEQELRPVVREKRAVIKDHYNELLLPFRGGYSVRFRAYDQGVAYRIETSLRKQVTVTTEEVTFNFTADHTGFFPVADGLFSHSERPYSEKSLADMKGDSLSFMPALIDLGNGIKVVITEADLYDYPGLMLTGRSENSNQLYGAFAHYPKREEQTSDRDVRVPEREAYVAKTNGSRTFPWRLMAISDDDGELLQNQMVYQLSMPLVLEDVSWIKPGKVAWDWYNANNIHGVEFESGINTETYKYYIDFASEFGLDYIILDEGWYDIKTNDLLNPVPDMDVPALISYGREKNVGIIPWVTWKALEDQLQPAMDQFESWGVKGIKVDFMQRNDQWMVNYYRRVAQEGADRKLLVDFHGSYKPSGLRRAYPNVISREGVRGLEQNKWEGMYCNPEYDTQIPFTRQLAGPVDYTPGAMRNAQKANYAPIFNRPMSLGTRVHQLALYVVLESPLQMLADAPSSYYPEKECMEFLSAVPVVWDETHIVDAKFSDYVATARKKDNQWFVGAITDWSARNLEIDLSFLEEGAYNIDIYQDGVNAEKYASDFKKVTQKVSKGDKLTVHLASGGGWAARIYK